MAESAVSILSRRPVALALAGGAPTLAAAFGPSGAKQTDGLSGAAAVIDGDTLSIGATHVRLEGIDAPETAQTCGRARLGSWACGQAAADALEKLVSGRRVACEAKGHDKYERVLGVCLVDGRDINAEMVRQGLAWAFVKYSSSYV
jgi:endonuclease YncB( thermonuclease family)